ncbi:MAG: anti-sigma factor [Ramlibacter sp.]
MNPINPPSPPVTEADLQAFVDEQLPAARQREVEAYLAQRPQEARRVQDYRAHKRKLHALFDPVLDEPLPQRLRVAARRPIPWYLQRLAAGVAVALVSGAVGWGLRGQATPADRQLARSAPAAITMASATGFAQRAAIAHAVYSPDQRRAVEVDAAHEDQLVAWLSKRIGAPMKPPHLQPLGYTLEGGRLLPGGQGPVAQFMYHDNAGAKLTLYVSREISQPGSATQGDKNKDTRFRFAREGSVNVFYWVDGPFGYAISADADKAELARVSTEVYQQLVR